MLIPGGQPGGGGGWAQVEFTDALKSHLEAVLSKFKILSCTKGPFVIYA